MTIPMPPVTLAGQYVSLEPLALEHVDDLVDAASADRSTYRWTAVPDGYVATTEYVAGLLAGREAGLYVPFAQRRLDTGRVVGCTRFMDLKYWSGIDLPDEIEIGGTWLSSDSQRTPINTEAKLLLLTHAFETIGVWRVAICTDANNQQSRAAILRIGATFEGILRNHRLSTGASASAHRYRNTAVHSITVEEWPAVKAHLVKLRDQPSSMVADTMRDV